MENCVFCDRSQFEERLCGKTKDFWIIATLGQITDGGYVLLVPKQHVECVGAMEEREAERLDILIDQTRGLLYREYKLPSVVFEHGIVGQTIKHAHIHIVSANITISEKVHQDFPDCGRSVITYLTALCNLYTKLQKPYLLLRESGFVSEIIWNPPAPLQYLRTVAAEALGRPERANWRNMDPKLDKKLWSETVRRLKTYKF